MVYREILETAVRAADAGASELRQRFRISGLEVRRKEENDPVTSADEASEAAILEVIRGRFPDHEILAEERGLENPGGHLQWVVDPLDGTNNFVQGLPMFSISIACLEEGAPVAAVVLDPIHDERYTATRGGGAFLDGEPLRVSKRPGLKGAFLATGYPFRAHEALDLYLEIFREVLIRCRGIRRCGSAALDLSYTAAGVYDGFFEFRLSPWDIAAGVLLIREAGGRVSDLDGGGEFLSRGNVLAGSEGVWQHLREIVSPRATETILEELEGRSTSGEAAVAR
ncbi:MAG: inositol monophosphatase family protein [Thermoanaerobaculia bacterium]|nr:inositol monophosphatase family protein [Thermoanaerobaculia bacterium]